jgi:hypothetical protein
MTSRSALQGASVGVNQGEEVSEMGRGRGSGGGRGDGAGRGGGRGPGRMGGGQAAGPGGYCVCSDCGHQEPHKAGVPCYRRRCPKCGGQMTRGT